MTPREIPVELDQDGGLVAAGHGPWCSDARTFPPPPTCAACIAAERDRIEAANRVAEQIWEGR